MVTGIGGLVVIKGTPQRPARQPDGLAPRRARHAARPVGNDGADVVDAGLADQIGHRDGVELDRGLPDPPQKLGLARALSAL